MDGESLGTMAAMGPVKLWHPFKSAPLLGFWKPPWWISRTMAWIPWRSSCAAAALATLLSSRKRSPLAESAEIMAAVFCRVTPMKPIFTPPTVRMVVAGKIGLPGVCVSSTFPARYW